MITEEAVGPLESDEYLDARAVYKAAKKQGVGQEKKDGAPKRGGDKARGGGQTLNGFNRRTSQGSER